MPHVQFSPTYRAPVDIRFADLRASAAQAAWDRAPADVKAEAAETFMEMVDCDHEYARYLLWEYCRLRDENQAVMTRLNAVVATLTAISQNVDGANTSIVDLKTSILDLKTSFDQERTEIRSANATAKQGLEETKKSLDEAVIEAKSVNATAKQGLEETKKSLDEAVTEAKSVNATSKETKKSLDEAVTEAKSVNATAKQGLEDATKCTKETKTSLDQSISASERTNTTTLKSVKGVTKRMKKAVTEIKVDNEKYLKRTTKTLKKYNKVLGLSKVSLDQSKTSLDESMTSLDRTKKSVDKSTTSLDQSKTSLDGLKEVLDESKTSLNDVITEAKSARATAEGHLEGATKSINDVKESLVEKMDDAVEEVSETKSTLELMMHEAKRVGRRANSVQKSMLVTDRRVRRTLRSARKAATQTFGQSNLSLDGPMIVLDDAEGPLDVATVGVQAVEETSKDARADVTTLMSEAATAPAEAMTLDPEAGQDFALPDDQQEADAGPSSCSDAPARTSGNGAVVIGNKRRRVDDSDHDPDGDERDGSNEFYECESQSRDDTSEAIKRAKHRDLVKRLIKFRKQRHTPARVGSVREVVFDVPTGPAGQPGRERGFTSTAVRATRQDASLPQHDLLPAAWSGATTGRCRSEW